MKSSNAWLLRPLRPSALTMPDVTRVREAERIADRDDVVADAQRRRIAERDARQVRGLDLQHREVGAFVGADDARREAAVLEQRDGDLVGVRDDVVVREDVAVAPRRR